MAKQTKALVQEAERLGIEVDGRWGDETIQEKIDAAAGGTVAKQVEALTDGEGDPATSGEAGDATAAAAEFSAGGDGGGAQSAGLSDRTPDDRSALEGDQDAGEAAQSAAGADAPEALAAASGDGDPAGSGDAPVADGDGGSGTLQAADAGGDAAALDAPLPVNEDEALAAARKAMTGPIGGAFLAASAVYGTFTGTTIDGMWFAPGASSDATIAIVSIAAPFVRTWKDAPAEALYITVRNDSAMEHEDIAWADLPPAARIAWEVFRDTLVKVDAMMAAEHARILGEAGVAPRTVPIDETTLEEIDDPFALTETGLAQVRRAEIDEALAATGL